MQNIIQVYNACRRPNVMAENSHLATVLYTAWSECFNMLCMMQRMTQWYNSYRRLNVMAGNSLRATACSFKTYIKNTPFQPYNSLPLGSTQCLRNFFETFTLNSEYAVTCISNSFAVESATFWRLLVSSNVDFPHQILLKQNQNICFKSSFAVLLQKACDVKSDLAWSEYSAALRRALHDAECDSGVWFNRKTQCHGWKQPFCYGIVHSMICILRRSLHGAEHDSGVVFI